MGVGIQREPSGEVTQHTADGLDIHTVLQGNRGKGVAESGFSCLLVLLAVDPRHHIIPIDGSDYLETLTVE